MPGERGMARDGRGPRLAGPANRLSQRACFTSWASSMARVLAFTAAIVLRAPLGTLAQDVRAAPPSTLTGILANNQTCLFHNDCPGDRFCLQPPGSQYRGNCYQCWRCCLFPDIWGACPEQCNCNRGSACAQPQDCGQGLFCATEPTRLTAQPLCQPCTGCFTDSQEISGACSSSCPSASLSYSGFTSASSSVTQFVFLAFLAYEISPSTASSADVGTMSQDDLTAWLNWEGLNKNKSQLVLSALTAAQPAPVSVLEFISVLTKLDSTSISCPSIQSLPLATTVEQGVYVCDSTRGAQHSAGCLYPVRNRLLVCGCAGCACNATEGAVTFRCPAGQRCSSAQFKLLSSDALNNPSAIRTRAVCVPCSPSQYCPEGTFVKDELDLASLDCPAGFYCPTPAEVQPCPAGSYCVPRTVTPLSCDYDKLLAAAPFTKLPVESNTVLERLRDHGDPYKGNICPVSSTEPNNLCRGGYFCPSPSVSYLCPEGHFCKPQSISPRKCSILTRCPAGTSSPRWSILAFVILSVVLVALPLTHWTLRRIDSSSTRYEDLERFELKRNKAIKVTRQLLQSIKARSMAGKSAEMNAEMQAKYAGFGMVEPRIRLDFEQLGLTLPGQGHVLEGVSGYFPPGKMSAVMGPSGSGKTTFLNVLCGKASGVVTGQVLVNGIPMSIGQTHKITGFVPQDDIVHEDLTVRENLSYAAHMKLPRDLADGHTRKAVIDDALEMLQLKHIQHYRVGSVEKRGISGGQRKRVNIGIELVGSPSVLFLDEPTSGLDSTASNDILKSLADMAALGMNVIAVIHQPRFSSFMLFDQVLLLGHGGTTVFMGPPGVAVLYFEVGLGFTMPPRENPADVLMDIIGGKVTREGDARFKPAQLSEWWVSRGQEWVSEFCRLNQGQAGDIIAVEPGMIEHMEDEFDRVDEECTGRVGVDGLMEIFESLGHTLDVDDAKLLMKRMYHGQYGGNKDGGDEDDEVMSDDLTVTREQLVELFQSMSERTRTNGRIEALERYQSDKMTFNYPKIDVTGMLSNPTTRAPSQAGDGPSCTNTTQCTPRHGHNDHLRADESVLIGSNGGYAGPADGTASPTELIISDSRTPLGEANDRLTGGRPTFNEITASWSAKVAWDAGDGQVPGLAAMSSRTSLDQARDGAGLASLVEAVTQRVNALGSSGRIFPEPTTVIPRLGTWTDAGDSRAHHISRSYPATPRDPEAPPACRPLSARDSHQSNVHTATMQLADVRSFLNARDARPMGEAIEEDGAEVDRMRSIAEGQISPGKHQPAALASAEVEDFREASSSLPVSSSPYFTGLLDSNGTPGSPYGQSPLAGTAVSHHNSGLQVSGGGLPYIRSMLGMQGLAPESSSSLSRAAVTAKVSGLGPPSPLREKGGTSTPGKDPRERQYVDKLLMGVMASHASMHALGPTSSSRSKTVQQRLGLISTTNSVLKPQQASSIFPVAPSGPSTLPQRIMSVWRMGSNVGLVQLSDKSRARLAVASAAAAAQGLKDQEELVTLLQERSFPGFLTQVQLLLRRGILQYVRNFWPTKVIDVALLLLASFIIGSIHGTNWSLNSVPTNSVMSMTCLGVLSTVTHLRTFSQHRLLMWRETASGISMPAYFLASNMIDLIWIVTAPSLFLGPYYYLTLPRMAWTSFFLVGLQVCWWASGMAYLVSAVLPPTTVLIAGVFLALIMGSFLQGLTPTVASARGSGLEVFMGISYNRWAMEILSINEFQHYQDNLRNVMIMIAKSVGICGLDTQLVDDGQPGLSPREAISFLRIQVLYPAQLRRSPVVWVVHECGRAKMCGILAVLNSTEDSSAMRARVLSLSSRQRHRGPDWSGLHQHKNHFLAHERLAIIDPATGDQPLFNEDRTISVTVNGEIYNYKDLKAKILEQAPNKQFSTNSDCEVISHLYEIFGEKMFGMLDGFFAFVILDTRDNSFYMARDPIGITCMYLGWGSDGSIWVANEMKAIKDDCARFQQFPPGHYYSSKTGEFHRYYNPQFYLDFEAQPRRYPSTPLDLVGLRTAFEKSVEKRLMSDVPFGVLLSGGLDSSLVAAVANRVLKRKQDATVWGKLHSFCVGLPGSPDLKAARQVADFLGTDHHEFHFTVQEGIDAIGDVIYHVETFDTTTIRASTPMFLMSRKIKALGVKMVLSGEGSDEVFGGYLYFHKAPNKEEFHDETVRKIQALFQYDCLRANKSTMAWGVEARVPFLDKDFLNVAMAIDPKEKMIDKAQGRIEKYIIRKAFDTPEDPYLPAEVLWRQKEQFSDGVGYNWIDGLKAHAELLVTDEQLRQAAHVWPDNTPKTKEAYWYRTIFESHFPSRAAAETVPGGPSVACSTPTAALWDAAWAGNEDPSGRAVAGVHDAAYTPVPEQTAVKAAPAATNTVKVEVEA